MLVRLPGEALPTLTLLLELLWKAVSAPLKAVTITIPVEHQGCLGIFGGQI